jgi:hypothetical protein
MDRDPVTLGALGRLARALVIADTNGDCDYAAAAAAADRIPDPVLRWQALVNLGEIEERVETIVRLAPPVSTGHGTSAAAAVPHFARDLMKRERPAPESAPDAAPGSDPAPRRRRRAQS